MADEQPIAPPKERVTKKSVNAQIENCKATIDQNIGIIKYCENLLIKADLPEE